MLILKRQRTRVDVFNQNLPEIRHLDSVLYNFWIVIIIKAVNSDIT